MAIKHDLLKDYEHSGAMAICLESLCPADDAEEQLPCTDSDTDSPAFPWDILYSTDNFLPDSSWELFCPTVYSTDDETRKLPAEHCYLRISRSLRRTLRRAPLSLVRKVEGQLKTAFLAGSTTMAMESPYQRTFVHATCQYYGLISTTERSVITIRMPRSYRSTTSELPELSLSNYLSINEV
ncbi:hypothetical protein PSACC_02909 [Paramicrosporidium saccamoebae]|uniref:R3H domain-containing protein n=1 Tax=Paramicrosporidium saccamoebae TaxID=1246581 RepID=A0A2H9THU3_9FUNG|nr:hypothetical protein PSACC_02909 [Paramicrosporidium saccamoebae]